HHVYITVLIVVVVVLRRLELLLAKRSLPSLGLAPLVKLLVIPCQPRVVPANIFPSSFRLLLLELLQYALGPLPHQADELLPGPQQRLAAKQLVAPAAESLELRFFVAGVCQ